MYSQQFYIIVNFLMMIDAIVIAVTGYTAYQISLVIRMNGLVMAWYDFVGSVLFVMFVNNYSMGRFGFYSARRFSSTLSMSSSLLAAVSLSFGMLSAGIILIGIQPFSRVYLLAHFSGALIALTVTRLAFYYYLDRRAQTAFNSYHVLLFGNKERIIAVAKALEEQRSWGHRVAGCLDIDRQCNPRVGSVPVLGSLEDFNHVLHGNQIDEVIFALPKGSPILLKEYLRKCKRIGVAVRIVPALFDLTEPSLKVETLQGIPTLTDYAALASASGLLCKKILDLVAGLFGFLVFLFLYPIVALAIKLDSPGPVLFKHRRVGLHGREFDLYKFRSMVTNAESAKADLLVEKESPWPIYKTKQDPRLTRVGRFLRKTSLDEIPQFINVLKGEMTLVGTRPPTPGEVRQYKDWHRRRISIKPGITGLWQISGRKEISDFAEVVKLDLQYIDGWLFRKDLAILWKTIWVVLARKGAK